MNHVSLDLPQSLLTLATEVGGLAHAQRASRSPHARGRRRAPASLPEEDPSGSSIPNLAATTQLVRELLQKRMPLPAQQFVDEDLMILALLFAGFMDNNRSRGALKITREIAPEGVACLVLLDRVRHLLQLGLVEAEADCPPNRCHSLSGSLNRAELAEARIQLHPTFLRLLVGSSGHEANTENSPAIEDNANFLQHLLEYGQILRNRKQSPASPLHRQGASPSKRTEPQSDLEAAWQGLLGRVATESTAIPFLAIAERCQLDACERNALVYLFDEKARGHDCSVDELCGIIGEDLLHSLQCRKYFSPGGNLARGKVIQLGPPGLPELLQDMVRLSPAILEELLGNVPPAANEPEAPLDPHGLLKELPVHRTWSELVLPPLLDKQLDLIVRRFENNVPDVLRRWGVLPTVHLNPGSSAPVKPVATGLRLLFSGTSGTGKTLSAEAIAGRLGRRLLVTDMSRLLSKWVGESQQNVTEVFDQYERIVAVAKAAPVLLLDECDQFLLRRQSASTSSERMYHEMQNLFLDRLDKVGGLVIATTNLVESLDPAFSRRFDYKLVFPEPGARERERIWPLHLPADVPLVESIDFAALAQDFPFSGGQIAISVRNAVLEAATRGDGLRMEDLQEAARCEMDGAFVMSGGRTVGFALA